ncbi:MAG: hypothetical protein RL274_2658 [Pseudomonadota bacterium]|jgi:lipid-A-disaccharide synthase-like uncharacterized protein
MGLMAHWYMTLTQKPYDTVWALVGFMGQAVFGVRFLIQWLRSEQEGHSVIPLAFWYCSMVGALIMLVYTIHMQAWPLVMGQAVPLPIYARNIWMIYRDRRAAR